MVIPDDETRNFLRDVGSLLSEKALDAKATADAANGDDRQFALGRLMAFHEVVSLLQQQARAFGIDPRTIGLGDIDPEAHLL